MKILGRVFLAAGKDCHEIAWLMLRWSDLFVVEPPDHYGRMNVATEENYHHEIAFRWKSDGSDETGRDRHFGQDDARFP